MFNSKNFGSLHDPYHTKDIMFFRVTKPNSSYSEKMVPGPKKKWCQAPISRPQFQQGEVGILDNIFFRVYV
jgi:hypothetical protein